MNESYILIFITESLCVLVAPQIITMIFVSIFIVNLCITTMGAVTLCVNEPLINLISIVKIKFNLLRELLVIRLDNNLVIDVLVGLGFVE